MILNMMGPPFGTKAFATVNILDSQKVSTAWFVQVMTITTTGSESSVVALFSYRLRLARDVHLLTWFLTLLGVCTDKSWTPY
jgi:hypothetical protein